MAEPAESPGTVSDLLGRGATLYRAGRFEEALECYTHLLAAAPDNVDGLNNRGAALAGVGRYDEALASCARALALDPDNVETLNNLGIVLKRLGRSAEALACFARAQAIRPGQADANWNEALCRLLIGDYALGWEKYEWRWKVSTIDLQARRFAQPPWRGEPISHGRTMLLHAEQGLGDILQFVRYAPLVAARGADVTLEVPEILAPLMSGLVGVRGIVARREHPPAFDLHCPLLSLPLAFRTTLASVPASVPYLSVDPSSAAHWRRQLAPANEKLVGVCWRGSANYAQDRERSMSLADAGSALAVPGVRFVSLQKELLDTELQTARTLPGLIHPGADFGRTAEIVAACDLVISVDTVWAHWAGAIGKTVWVLLPHVPHWIWLAAGSSSPWYPTARLFRQEQRGGWESVVHRVKKELARLPGALPGLLAPASPH